VRRRALSAFLGVSLAVSSQGCFFDSPLDAHPSVPIDSEILGTWRCLAIGEGPDSHPANFVVKASDAYRYTILFQETPDSSEQYEAYASRVGDESILNVHVPGDSAFTKPWALARYSLLRPDVLEVQVVDETKLEGADQSPETLRHAFQRLQRDPYIFQDYCVCVRAKEKKDQSALESASRPTRA
jgi:hypothetical protein